jgi:beta-galactosidase
LWEAGIACDVVAPDADLARYRLVVVPNLYMVSEAAAARLAEYVHGGGHAFVSFFSGIVDEYDRVHLGGYPGLWRDLLGVSVQEHWPLDEGERVLVRGGGSDFAADTWGEHVDLRGAEALASFASGDLDGLPALTRHRHGSGIARYLATRPEPAAMARMVGDAVADAGVTPVLPGAPPGVEAVIRRGADADYLFVLNHTDGPAEFTAPPGAEPIVGGKRLGAGDVAVLRIGAENH